jgi:uncharacterized membrane protein
MSVPKKLLLLFVAIGIVDSAYLTLVHYTNLPLYCPQGGIVNCVQVTTSVFSQVAGIPIALGGLVWFIGLGMLVFVLPKIKVLRNVWIILGLGGVAYSIIGQAILGEICEYCVLLDVMILLSVYILIRLRHSDLASA